MEWAYNLGSRDGVITKQMYSSRSTITLECSLVHFHDYFNEYPVSTVKATLKESLFHSFSVVLVF